MMEEKFEHWLPFYVNGTLDAAERAEMERYLATDVAAREDVMLFSKAATAMHALGNRASDRIGLDKAIAKNRASSPASMGRLKAKPTGDSVFTKLREWFGGSWLQPAFALALVVIGVQTSLLFRGDDAMQMRGASPSTSAVPMGNATSYLRVTFAPTATEGELRVLLAGSNASFAAGPDSSGAYTVSVPNDQAVKALELLRASRVVVAANPSERP